MGFLIFLILALLFLVMGAKILPEYERGVVFRLGRYAGTRDAGLRFIIPGVDRMVRIGLREIVMDVPAQEVITRDNVSVKVNAVLYFRVLHPEKAVIQVENYLYGTSQLAQTTLRSVCGQAELDDLLAERERINQKLQEIIDSQTEPWGVKVRAVELKQIDLPQEMQRVMAKQAEAEREKRAKVTLAEGEFLAAQRIADAAQVLSTEPSGLQLRYLQTLAEIAGSGQEFDHDLPDPDRSDPPVLRTAARGPCRDRAPDRGGCGDCRALGQWGPLGGLGEPDSGRERRGCSARGPRSDAYADRRLPVGRLARDPRRLGLAGRLLARAGRVGGDPAARRLSPDA